jgi:hypothetical protein
VRVKTHYQILSLDNSADSEAIKKAFRREIARYHPDKVIHLGAEFQELAATRAAELTVAYKTLTDPALREEYDHSIAAGLPPPHLPQEPRPPVREAPPQAQYVPQPGAETPPPPSPTGGKARFATERANRDIILKRAVTGRVLSVVEAAYGKLDTPTVRGFDLAMVPLAKPRFLGAPPPRVLVRIVAAVDPAAVTEAYNAASRARVHNGKSPVVVLLCSSQVASQGELSHAHEANARQRKAPDSPHEVVVVVVEIADWSCRIPPDCSTVVRKLVTEICG